MYGENTQVDAKYLLMPFENSNISMMIILPNKRDGILALESTFTFVKFQNIAKIMKKESVNVRIPKFRIEFEIEMKKVLEKV